MNSINDKVYLIAMMEVLLNGNTKTDLGTHVLEYTSDVATIDHDDLHNGKTCLAVGARLRNKSTDLIDWGELYYKHVSDTLDTFKEKMEDLENSDYNEKIEFILKPENLILRKPYDMCDDVKSKLSNFFENLGWLKDDDEYPTVILDGPFPKVTVTFLNDAFDDALNERVIQKVKIKK